MTKNVRVIDRKNGRVIDRVCNTFNIASGKKEAARLSLKHDALLDQVEMAEALLKTEKDPALRRKCRQALKKAEGVLLDLRHQINEALFSRS